MVKLVAKVDCIGVEKRTRPNKHQVYVLSVTWNDGVKHPVYRTYSAFFDFRGCLREATKTSDVMLPELPALKTFERGGLFSREVSIEKRKKIVNDFCEQVLALSKDIIPDVTVTSFFETWPSDFVQAESQGTSDLGRHSPKSSPKVQHEPVNNMLGAKARHCSLPDAAAIFTEVARASMGASQAPENRRGSLREIPDSNKSTYASCQPGDEGGQAETHYKAVCAYSKRKNGEVNLQEGDIIDVLEKNLSGWWFVHVESTREQGWAPGAFLEPLQNPDVCESSNNSTDTETEPIGVFRTLCDYCAMGLDEISYTKGTEVEVLVPSLDGWWKVRCNGQVGYTPSTNLEQVTSHKQQVDEEEDPVYSHIKNGLMHQKSIYIKGPPPRRSSSCKPVNLDEIYAKVKKHRSKDQNGGQSESETGSDQSLYDNNVTCGSSASISTVDSSKLSVSPHDSPYLRTTGSQKPDIIPRMSTRSPVPERRPLTPKQDEVKVTSSPPSQTTHLTYTQVVFSDSMNSENRPIIGGDCRVEYSEIIPRPKPAARKCLPKKTKSLDLSCTEEVPKQTSSSSQTNGARTSEVKPKQLHQYVNVELQNRCPSPSSPSSQRAAPVHVYENVRIQLGQHRVIKDYTTQSGLVFSVGDFVMVEKSEDTMCYCVQNLGTEAGTKEGWVPKSCILLHDADINRRDAYKRRVSTGVIPIPKEPPPKPPADVLRVRNKCDVESVFLEALCDFNSPSENILSFRKGDQAHLLNKSLTGWWCINIGGACGWVPADFWVHTERKGPIPAKRAMKNKAPNDSVHKETISHAWFVGKMSRQQSEALLMEMGGSRDFLVRESINRVGDFTLCVRYKERVRHFPIESTPGGKFYIGKHHFKDLLKVVQYYQEHPLFFDEQQDAVMLGAPVVVKR